MRKFLALIVALAILGLVGCSSSNTPNIVENEIFLCKSNSITDIAKDLYIKTPEKEIDKLESDVTEYQYLRNSKAMLLLCDSEETDYFDLFIKRFGQDKEEICSGTYAFSIEVTPDEAKVFYAKDGNSYEVLDLYEYKLINNDNKEAEKIASNIGVYKILDNGNSIIYQDEIGDLYLKKEGEEPKKISTGIYDELIVSENGSSVCFMTGYNSDLYIRKLLESENIKITPNKVTDITLTLDGNRVFYITNYDYTSKSGELYCYDYGKESKKIAADVLNYQISGDGSIVSFSNNEKKLYTYYVKEDKKDIIIDEVSDYIMDVGGEIIVYKDDNGNVYLKEEGKEKEKIGFDCIAWYGANGKVVYLNRDLDLYLFEFGKEKKKIASDVEDCVLSPYGNSISYYTKDKELYLLEFGKEKQLIVDSIMDYCEIRLGNNLLYERTLQYNDLIGKWKIKEHQYDDLLDIYIEFTTNEEMIISCPVTGEREVEYISEFIGNDRISGTLIKTDASELFVTYAEKNTLNLAGGIILIKEEQ